MSEIFPEKWLVVIAVLLGTFTIILNNSMLNPTIPYLMEIFNADAVTAGWTITIFMVVMGVTMPATGYLGDKLGKKQLYLTGLSIFILGSVLASFSWSLQSLIVFRAVQGVAGGIMMPLSMALIFEVFPRHERGLATGIWGIAAMLAPTIGPTIGGLLIEKGSWQWLFLFNIPTGILGLIIGTMYLRKTKKNKEITFDKWGFIAVTLGVGILLFALGRVATIEQLTEPMNVLLLVSGFLLLYVFVQIEKKVDHPLLDLSIFRTRAYTISVIISVSSSLALFGGIFLVPLLMQHVYDYGAITTGFIFLPSALFTGIFMSVGGRILDERGPTLVVTAGLCIIFFSTVFMGFLTMTSSIVTIFILMAIRGIGMGLSTMPATTAGMNSIPEQSISRGSATNNVLKQMSSALSIVFSSIYYEVRRVQIQALEAVTSQEASLQAINESFLILSVVLIIVIPFGVFLGKEVKRQEEKRICA